MADYGKMSKSQLLKKYGSFIKENFGKKELDFVKGEDTDGVIKYIQDLDPEPVKKKDGGLMEAINKVKKEDAVKMEAGGDPVNALKGGQKKLDKNKDGKISGEDFEILRNMKFGGSVKPVKMGGGGNVCKGMGIARAGGKFKLR